MQEDLIIINDRPDIFKPFPAGNETFASKALALASGQPLDFIYVGDNTAKDFLYPNQHGWKTVCLLEMDKISTNSPSTWHPNTGRRQ